MRGNTIVIPDRKTSLSLPGSHCLVEWDEPGNPRNVVPTKTVTGKGDGGLTVGNLCDVEIRKGSKKSCFQAKLIGIGEFG